MKCPKGCDYVRAWSSQCGRLVEDDGDYCEDHVLRKCCVCHRQATHDCDETWFLVCGKPLCGSCRCICLDRELW